MKDWSKIFFPEPEAFKPALQVMRQTCRALASYRPAAIDTVAAIDDTSFVRMGRENLPSSEKIRGNAEDRRVAGSWPAKWPCISQCIVHVAAAALLGANACDKSNPAKPTPACSFRAVKPGAELPERRRPRRSRCRNRRAVFGVD